jgi:hypothetical protein
VLRAHAGHFRGPSLSLCARGIHIRLRICKMAVMLGLRSTTCVRPRTWRRRRFRCFHKTGKISDSSTSAERRRSACASGRPAQNESVSGGRLRTKTGVFTLTPRSGADVIKSAYGKWDRPCSAVGRMAACRITSREWTHSRSVRAQTCGCPTGAGAGDVQGRDGPTRTAGAIDQEQRRRRRL